MEAIWITLTHLREKTKPPQLAYPFKQIASSTKFTFYKLWDCTTTPYWLALDICYVYWEKDKNVQHISNATWIVNIFTLLLMHDYNSYLTTTPTTWMVFFFALSNLKWCLLSTLIGWQIDIKAIWTLLDAILHAFGMRCVWHFS